MEDAAKQALARLRRRFGLDSSQQNGGARTPQPLWTRDTHGRPAGALARRYGIDPARYDASPCYRKQVDALCPAFAAARDREKNNGG